MCPVISADHFQAYEPLLEDVVSHRFEDVEHRFYMQKGHLENIHYSNTAGGKPRTYAIGSHHLTSRWSRLFREHCSPRIASYSEGWADMPQGTSENLTGLTNSHTYKNGCVFSAIALQNSIKALPTMLSHELFFFFFARIAEQARTSSTLRCSHSWSYQWHLCGECITLPFQRWRLLGGGRHEPRCRTLVPLEKGWLATSVVSTG